ncbi:toll/interleukin-1 receptor domain-containing protein [uncultured Mucilaginibacter sp.]|uniref:toll/interleukin-1 receptor domain-containing protein n=1 Tax=uncultured Mucilaginibacter sp. TaxID=797541 RepID=UPI0026160323|nr:toll/interleukin-1 receptor domain-containing protein [uncultured Mucilaginibacter sp.]
MATLKEYYLKDFSRLLSTHIEWTLRSPTQEDMSVTVKTHLDFDSNVFFVSFYVPETKSEISIFNLLLSKLEEAFKIKDTTFISTKLPGEMESNSADLRFSGRVFFYYEGVVDESEFQKLQIHFKTQGLFIHFRDINFSVERSNLEVPLAFISHDSRDKDLIASKIANELQKRVIPIWYDEYSLKLGDSLRESIEKGLKECKKCILILSPNFLNNAGWTKTEFNTIFTREIIETQNLVLPIWVGVNKKEIYEYSPTLVDRIGVSWEKGLEFVVNKIQHALIVE